jgi:hypothetical protein
MEPSVKESRPRRTAAEIKDIFRQQEDSNETIKAFCARKGSIEKTFYKWRNSIAPEKLFFSYAKFWRSFSGNYNTYSISVAALISRQAL